MLSIPLLYVAACATTRNEEVETKVVALTISPRGQLTFAACYVTSCNASLDILLPKGELLPPADAT